MRPAEKLKARIEKDLGLPVVDLESINRGHWGKSDGVHRWMASGPAGEHYASEDSISRCLRAPRIAYYIDPIHPNQVMICAEGHSGGPR
jgi:hypothetical protein